MNRLLNLYTSLKNQSVEKQFWFLLAFTSAVKLLYLSVPNLVPQEAYYWSWGLFPDWSYFDHPPLATYSMIPFIRLFGNTVFWIRFPVWLYSILDGLVIFLIAKTLLKNTRVALWGLLMMNLTPLFLIGSIILTPDVPLIFFWFATVAFFGLAVEKGRFRDWILAGACAGLAMLGKYPGVLLFPSALLYLALSPKHRHWLKTPYPYLTVLPAALMFLPVIIWNAQHEWVSLLFQTSRRAGEVSRFRLDTFLQLITAQMGVTNPVLFVCFLAAMIYVLKTGLIFRDSRYGLLFSFSVVPLMVCVLISLGYFVKMNWMAPSYATGFLLTAMVFTEQKHLRLFRKWFKISIFTGILFMVFTYMVPAMPLYPLPGDTWTGWPELGQKVAAIKEEMEKENKVFVFGNRYKVSVEMWFYHPEQERTYAQNILGKKALQFDYWSSPEALKGQNAIFVVADIEGFKNMDALKNRFERVIKEEDLKVVRHGITFRTFNIYRCYGYKGPHPGQDRNK